MRVHSRLIAGLLLFLRASPAWAGFTFHSIDTMDQTNAASGEAQLRMTVQDAGNSRVQFLFTNNGPAWMSVCDVYFDGAGLLGKGTALGSSGVSFNLNANLSALPGSSAVDPAFATSSRFTQAFLPAGSGLNPGEWLSVTFDLANNTSYADVVAALSAGAALQPGDDPAGTLRVGLFVVDFGTTDDAHESFLNNGPEGPRGVPAPAAILLVASGLPVLGLWSRLRRRAA
ncbi:MAG TPA: hypothetical protein VLM40_12565 [Gemmata sp.]|nr:hypothetical protein [Gemmata sp.]